MIKVQNCIAHDGDRSNAVTLTDERGCVLKKKLMGPWQKSRNSNQPGVSIVAFSFFQAFKFPDQMEVFLECDVELCKNGCDLCPDDAPLVFTFIINYFNASCWLIRIGQLIVQFEKKKNFNNFKM